MIYGSVCSGIEAASVAWHPLGWRAAFVSEIEPFPRAVLSERFPETPLHGDFTTIGVGDYEPIDLLVGGTPCQSFSIAGLRGGMADERGNLALEYLRLAGRLGPRWLVWENVPGVLSSNGGRDFGSILGGLVELGYGFSYRVLDAQHFGVPQRRRRVFVVGYLGDWRPAAAVLFERASLRRDPAPGREARENVAGTLETSTHDWTRNEPGAGIVTHTLRAEGFDASEDGTGRGIPLVPMAFDPTQITSPTNRSSCEPGAPSHAMAAKARPPHIAFSVKDHGADAGDISPTLRAMGHATSHANAGGQVGVATVAPVADCLTATWDRSKGAKAGNQVGMINPVIYPTGVRRLTPRECERLQGFPDDFTLVRYRNKPAADGPRYRALGNSMAVPVMSWIGQRIATVETLLMEQAA